MIVLVTISFAFALTCVFVGVFTFFETKNKMNKRLGGVKDELEFTEGEENDKNGFRDRLKQQQSERRMRMTREKAKKEVNNEEETSIEALLDEAGLDFTANQFNAFRVILMITGLMAGFFLTGILNTSGFLSISIIAGLALVAGILPTRLVLYKIKGKKNHIRQHLPDVMDLLVVSVEAGLGFDAALAKLYEKDKSPLMQEFMQASRDIKRGVSKKEAYDSLAKRCDVKEMTSFVMAIIQADQMGISVKSILLTQAESLREKRRQRAEEKALKAPVLMLIPLVVFIFPVIFIVLLGPAVINIMEMGIF
ncbi:MAG: type II secretion system F family protein [Eubacterium sp.]|nr:type II secretion system F family protein [Eubacterium sp.]